MSRVRISMLLLAVLSVASCKSDTTSSSPTRFAGAAVTIGSGTANTWLTTDASGNTTAIGVTISDAALASLGTKDSMYMLAMPTGVLSAFKSVGLDYATHDAAPYNKPHIDPHFMLLSDAALMGTMSGGMDGKMPTNMMFPSGYVTDSVIEPMMGVHWMDTTGSEFHGTPFQCAFEYGAWNGNMAFYEVMCDKASLDGHKGITNTIRKATMMSGMMMFMPSSYKISYDAIAKTSTIELDGF